MAIAGELGPGDQNLADVRAGGLGEVNELLELRPDGHLSGDQIDLAFDECRQQLLSGQRNEHHVHLVAVVGLQAGIQPLLEQPAVVGRDAALQCPCR